MRPRKIALFKAIALSFCICVSSSFFAMAADGTTASKNKTETETKDAIEPPPVPPISAEENQEIEQELSQKINEKTEEKVSEPASQKKLENIDDDIEQPEKNSLTTDEQIPIGVIVNGVPRDEAMTVYLPSGSTPEHLLVPIGALSELMSFAITAKPGEKKAEGFFRSEENNFQLDLNTNDVLVGGKKRSLEAGEARVQDDDIYVPISSVEEWFGISIDFDLSNLELKIDAGGDLPFQERMKRLMRAKNNEKTYTFDAIKPDEASLAPYKQFSLPSLYMTSSTSYQKSKTDSSYHGVSTLQGYQDLLGFEADYTMAGDYLGTEAPKIDNARLTLQKRDPLNRLLGPLKAGRISIGDINFPSVPLFAGGERGVGIEVSSDSRLGVRYANNTENYVLEGDAPVGYDAELYRNGVFVAFQQVGNDGRYSFNNLDLPTGFNTFEVILYGPQGQKTVIKRDVTRGARLLRKGETQYDFAAGAPRADLIPVGDAARKSYDHGLSAQVFHGITNFFTLGTSVFNGPEDEAIGLTVLPSGSTAPAGTPPKYRNASGGTVSAALSFLGMNVQGQILAADRGRTAYDTSINTRLFGTTLGVSHTTYKNFLEENQDLTDRNEIYINKDFKLFYMSLRAQQLSYLSKEDQTLLEHTLSFKLFDFSFNNKLDKTLSKDPSAENFTGEFTALTSLADIRFRGSLLYDLDPASQDLFKQATFSGQKRLGDRSAIRFEGSHDFQTKLNSLNLTYSQDYDKFGVDFDVGANSDNSYIFTLGLRMALQPDVDNKYHFVDPVSGGHAAVGARAFIDKNENGVYDAGDEPLEGISFRGSTSAGIESTNKEGLVYITNLGEAPIRLKVATESIPDIYLAPVFDHKDLIPRRGATPIIDFPFVKMGEIGGYLVHLKQGVEGAIVKLLSLVDGSVVEQTETDSDGYFLFPAVKGGKYKVSFGTPEKEYTIEEFDLDASKEEQPEMKVEASNDLVKAAETAREIKKNGGAAGGTGQANIDRMNAPAGEMPNIDDPLNEKDLKPINEKDVETIINQ